MTRFCAISLALGLVVRPSFAMKLTAPSTMSVMNFSGGYSNSTSDDSGNHKPEFVNVGEKMMFSGWRKVLRRDIKMPTGKVNSFDIVTQQAGSVTVFVW
jgi:hypothetical protein